MTRTHLFLFFDFETISDADLKAVGAWNYSRHPSTRVTCAAFELASSKDDEPVRYRWLPGQALPVEVRAHLESGGRVVAHNASFERSILANCFDVSHWPQTELDNWIDTAVLARAANLPGDLEGLAKAIKLPVQKDMEGNAVMRAYRTPEAWSKTTPEQRQKVYDYNAADVTVMRLAFWRLPGTTIEEREAMVADAEIGQRGVLLDTRRATVLARAAKARKRWLEDEAFTAAGADVVKVLTPQRLKPWLVERGVKLPKKMVVKDDVKTFVETADKAALAKLLESTELADDVRRVLELRTEHGKTASLAKLDRVPKLVGDDGRLRHALRFCGAQTGRWASYGIQVHNLPKNKLKGKGHDFTAFVEHCIDTENIDLLSRVFDSPLEAMSSSLRGLFVAPAGYDLIGADYAAIEARGVAWLAGEQAVLDIFASGQDIYVADAAGVGSDNRQLGKTLRLGLGYGMGGLKFLLTAAKDGIVLARKDAARMVKQWRTNNPAIVAFWRDLEAAAHAAVKAPGEKHSAGPITFCSTGYCLGVRLPSGRVIYYWQPRIVEVTKTIEVIDDEGNIKRREFTGPELQYFAPDDETGEFLKQSTYGGKLAENVTQAVCRDLLAGFTVRARGTVYELVLHVHDSAAAQVREGQGSVEEFCELMAATPAWGTGFPIKAEGYRAKRFKG